MSLRIRCLELRVETAGGVYGTHLRFEDGLVVLHAGNSSGKSTCLMSILYALGLEGMLGPSHMPPMGEAMVRRLVGEEGPLEVLESSACVEIENDAGERMTALRYVTGTNRKRELVTTQNGPALTKPSGQYARQDYFVRTSGAAQSGAGFHTRLAQFMGLELPSVPRHDGQPCPLYLEYLFPFHFVEQVGGWQGLENRLPTHLRVMEPWNRALEFLLRLDVGGLALRRHELLLKKRDIESKWHNLVEAAAATFAGVGYVPTGLPPDPVDPWPPLPEPCLQVTDGSTWLRLDDELSRQQRLLGDQEQLLAPSVSDTTSDIATRLEKARDALRDAEARMDAISEDIRLDQEQIAAVGKRVESLNRDLQEYRDEQRLRDRGSVASLRTAQGHCPTCAQSLKDTLADQTRAPTPMPLQTNIAYISEQIDLFDEMRSQSEGAIAAKKQKLVSLENRCDELLASIRALREAREASAKAPSVASIRERLLTEDRIRRLSGLKGEFSKTLAAFGALSKDWSRLLVDLQQNDRIPLSTQDLEKLALLRDSFVSQLKEYGFRSFPVDGIEVSAKHYRPVRDGQDLWGMSASDTIRTIWSYLVALLEVARSKSTNHLGLLILDEPRQQSADKMSFGALVKRLADAFKAKQQVIFATSEDEDSLRALLHGLPHDWHSLPSRVLEKVGAASR